MVNLNLFEQDLGEPIVKRMLFPSRYTALIFVELGKHKSHVAHINLPYILWTDFLTPHITLPSVQQTPRLA